MDGNQLLTVLRDRLLVVDDRLAWLEIDTPKPGTLDYQFNGGARRQLVDERDWLRSLISKCE